MAKILIIEDSSFQRGMIKRMVSAFKQDLEIVEAKNGQEGIQKIEDINPDLIFTDLVMPGTDGLYVLEELKKRENKTPVIVLTADIQSSVKNECLELGASEFIQKPVEEETLNSILEKHL